MRRMSSCYILCSLAVFCVRICCHPRIFITVSYNTITQNMSPSHDQPTHRNKVNNILRSFKRLKANAAEGGKPYKEDSVEFKDTVDGLNIVVRYRA